MLVVAYLPHKAYPLAQPRQPHGHVGRAAAGKALERPRQHKAIPLWQCLHLRHQVNCRPAQHDHIQFADSPTRRLADSLIHVFNPPSVSPLMNWRCKARNRATTGKIMISDAALVKPQSRP